MTTLSPPSSFKTSLKLIPILIVASALLLLVVGPLALYSAPDAVFQAFKALGGNEVTLVEFNGYLLGCLLGLFCVAFVAFMVGIENKEKTKRSFRKEKIFPLFFAVGMLSLLNLMLGLFADPNRADQILYVVERIEEVAPHSPVAHRMRQGLVSPSSFRKDRAWLQTFKRHVHQETPLYGLEALERIAPALAAHAIPAVADTIAEVRQDGVLTRQHRITIYRAILEHPELLASTDAERLASLFAPPKAPSVL